MKRVSLRTPSPGPRGAARSEAEGLPLHRLALEPKESCRGRGGYFRGKGGAWLPPSP